MIVALRGNPYGLGDTLPTGQVIGGSAVTGATAGITTGLITGSPLRGAVAAAGATIATLAPLAGPFAPLVAGFGAAVTLFANMFHGCGPTCVQATQLANQAQQIWQQIKDQYFAMPVRHVSDQQAALNAMDQVWVWLKDSCNQPALADAGQRCWTERQCNPNGKFSWCPSFRDPVANDPAVLPDPIVTPASVLASALNISPDSTMALLGVALVAAGVLLL